jgi:hypothetical protein
METWKMTGTSCHPRKSRTLKPRSQKTGMTDPPLLTLTTPSPKTGRSPSTFQTQMPSSLPIGMMRWTESGKLP